MFRKTFMITDSFKDGWKNVNGSGNREDDNCGSWLEHWKNITMLGNRAVICASAECNEIATDGSHVRHPSVPGVWIVPLCHKHNCSSEDLTLKDGAVLVRANLSETCDDMSEDSFDTLLELK